MGLDITAYSNLQYIGKHHNEQWCPTHEEVDGHYDPHIEAFAYAEFPTSFRGIPIVGTREIGHFGFIDGGCFVTTEMTKTHGFRAGSYGSYNRWREALSAQFNPEVEPDGPFYELINFADNEGCIGPEAAADLLADFHAHKDAWIPPYAWDTYDDWTKACELAATAGLIEFH